MKKPVSATIDEQLIAWLNSELKRKKEYRNKSHIIEIALEKLKAEEQKQKKPR